VGESFIIDETVTFIVYLSIRNSSSHKPCIEVPENSEEQDLLMPCDTSGSMGGNRTQNVEKLNYVVDFCSDWITWF
jgi:hypothetical protein